eukprot:CAMPEP_0197023898 /NCGR_PEP_ID=MMETSP1384-20130603/4539_1 /TAXON_ID=29189 /ORGANISM="Ammonia sp." /LENGTH=309 /DNA_ID=CAMNT_0042452195 /DNA_START=69 /DNA_END=998 /DNA_ORIENTATION=+
MTKSTCLTALCTLSLINTINAFGPPVIIATVAVSNLVASIYSKLSGDGVAIGIINHFSDATIYQSWKNVVDGDYIAGYSAAISPGHGGTGGGFDDGFLNWGGSAGAVRYKVSDPSSGTTYCMDIIWGQYSDDLPIFQIRGSYSPYNGVGFAIGPSLCNIDSSTAFSNFRSFTYQGTSGPVMNADSGTQSHWINNDIAMGWKERKDNNAVVNFNSMDGKVQVLLDMTNEGVAEIAVNVGPAGWYQGETPSVIPFDYSSRLVAGVLILCILGNAVMLVVNMVMRCKTRYIGQAGMDKLNGITVHGEEDELI